jgi:hypothetical protein
VGFVVLVQLLRTLVVHIYRQEFFRIWFIKFKLSAFVRSRVKRNLLIF